MTQSEDRTASPARRYEWITFVMVLLTLATLGVGTFLLARVERGIVAAVWLPLLLLLLWFTC